MAAGGLAAELEAVVRKKEEQLLDLLLSSEEKRNELRKVDTLIAVLRNEIKSLKVVATQVREEYAELNKLKLGAEFHYEKSGRRANGLCTWRDRGEDDDGDLRWCDGKLRTKKQNELGFCAKHAKEVEQDAADTGS